MSQTLSPAHARGPGFKLGQGLVLAAVAAAASLLTAAVMGGSRTAPAPAPQATTQHAPAASPNVPAAAHVGQGTDQAPGSAKAAAGTAQAADDFPLQEPAPTF